MKFLRLKTCDPYYNLAVEEYLFEFLDDDVFMLWQNEKTVVIGKNQNAFTEIDLKIAEQLDIKIARRITGGGAVYHDLGNVNYSYITKGGEINFEKFAAPVISALKTLGINAELSGRNDLTVLDKKISGNAQFTKNNRTLHHGTLLFDSNLEKLDNVLKVDREKLESKAIKSVSSRVTNIKPLLKKGMSTDEFIEYLERYIEKEFCVDKEVVLDNEKIGELRKRNASRDYLFPSRDFVSKYSLKNKKRYSFGTVEIYLEMQNLIIKDIKITGDFFENRPVSELEELLKNKNIKEDLKNLCVENYICGMKTQDFLTLLK